MTKISENLQCHFDENREPHIEQFEYLKAIGIDPKFAEKCSLMFQEISATTEEIMAKEDIIIAANDEVMIDLYKLDLKRKREHRGLVTKFSKAA